VKASPGGRRPAVGFDHWPYPRRIAHRGAGRRAPENTLAAIRAGFLFGYRMFEFDVKRAADDTLFLLHDATLDRTTDAKGGVAGQDWAALAALDAGSWHSRPFAGEPLARFDSVERFLRANRLFADVEIKPVPGDDVETGAAVAAHCARAWAGERVPPILTSFSPVALEAAGREAPALPRGLLLFGSPSDWLDRVLALDCVAVAFNEQVVSPALVAKAHEARLRVMTYTVNRAARVRTLERIGVDCVITDAVDKIAAHPGAAR
jgi:glycerophosphoryl diester phosphodiesterase